MAYTESQLGTQLSGILRRQNALVIPQVPTKYGCGGVPDWYICHNYWRGWLEKKAWNGKLSVSQQQMIGMLTERGDKVAVVRFLSGIGIKEASEIEVSFKFVKNADGSFAYERMTVAASLLLRTLQSEYGR